MKSLLQWLGVACVLGLVGASVAGLAVLKDRVRIIVQDDAVAAGPDPTTLLRDDVQVLQRDLAALAPAIGEGIERFLLDSENRAAARHQDLAALRREVAALQLRCDEIARGIAGLQSAVAAVASQGTQAGPPAAAVAEPDAATVPVAPPAASLEAATPAADAPSVAAAPPRAGGATFLSFQLPSAGFRFDQPQEFVLVPALCRIGFDAKSTLHDFSGVTSSVEGRFRADLHDPQAGWQGEVKVRAATLTTGIDGRDANMRDLLEVERHPEICFAIDRLEAAADGIDCQAQTVRGEIAGRMTIRGQTRALAMPVTIEVDHQKRVVINGQAKLRLSDYGITPPSQLGVISMQDEVVVWAALRARAQAGSGR
jgi:polyisoprenoid-binding protein YceI